MLHISSLVAYYIRHYYGEGSYWPALPTTSSQFMYAMQMQKVPGWDHEVCLPCFALSLYLHVIVCNACLLTPMQWMSVDSARLDKPHCMSWCIPVGSTCDHKHSDITCAPRSVQVVKVICTARCEMDCHLACKCVKRTFQGFASKLVVLQALGNVFSNHWVLARLQASKHAPKENTFAAAIRLTQHVLATV